MKWNVSEPTLRAAGMRGLVRGANIVRSEMIRLVLRTAKSGRIYRRRGVEHQSSAPGEPFASDTGSTLQSMSPPVAHASELRVTITVGGEAKRLEYGTTRMAARPFARVAANSQKDEVKAAILHELRQAGFGFKGGITHYSSKR